MDETVAAERQVWKDLCAAESEAIEALAAAHVRCATHLTRIYPEDAPRQTARISRLIEDYLIDQGLV